MPCHGYANCCRCSECSTRSAAFPKRLSPNKEVREEAETLRSLGFDYDGEDSRGHLCFDHERYGEIVLPCTPSAFHWRKAFRHRLARSMGFNRHQLECKINGQPVSRSEPKKRNGGPRSQESYVMEHAMALGIPCNKRQASALLNRFGTTRNARKALDGMVLAVLNQEAAAA